MNQNEHDTTEHDAFLCEYLSDRDEECPMCSYNLRGLTGRVCPECGEALRMRVSLCEPKMGLYLCGVIGWAVGAGFAGFMLGWVLFMQLNDGYAPGLSEIWPLWAQLVVQGLMLGLSLWKGRVIRKRGTTVRQLLAGSAWAFSFLFAFTFFAIVDA